MDKSMKSALGEMDGGKSSPFLQFVEIISCAEEILARQKEMSCKKKKKKEMSCLWHGEESCCVAECVGALLYPLGLMSLESSF